MQYKGYKPIYILDKSTHVLKCNRLNLEGRELLLFNIVDYSFVSKNELHHVIESTKWIPIQDYAFFKLFRMLEA